ncbi:nicotinate-nucleotide--dimethylbenzimidazole phosphoribosyltransferase, partial [Streptomyces sp. NPDC059072]
MTDPFEVLRHLGGLELAAIAGAVLAARMARIPVLLDGYT